MWEGLGKGSRRDLEKSPVKQKVAREKFENH